MLDPYSARGLCMKCNLIADSIMTTGEHLSTISHCTDNHRICISCFKAENNNNPQNCKCPYCKQHFFQFIESIEEGILIGEAITMTTAGGLYKMHHQGAELGTFVNKTYNDAIEHFERALLLNPSNLATKKCIFHLCINRLEYCNEIAARPINRLSLTDSNACTANAAELYRYKQRVYECCLDLIDKAFDASLRPLITGLHTEGSSTRTDKMEDYYDVMGTIFYQSNNYPMAVKYSKIAYSLSLRTSPPDTQTRMKKFCKIAKNELAREPPLRFAVGDVVESLRENESEDGQGEWKLGKIVEIFYRERDFEISFTAPYRIQLLDADADATNASPVYVWAEADIDRYVRKVGTRAMEDTRYQAQLDVKVAELAQVYCSEKFMQDIYNTLEEDGEFCEMLADVWCIELSLRMLYFYRMLVMYTEPLIPTDSGYHVPTAEEVIAGIKAYFHTSDAALASSSVISDESVPRPKRLKAIVIHMLQFTRIHTQSTAYMYKIDVMESMYLRFMWAYPMLLSPDVPDHQRYTTATEDQPFIVNYFSLELPKECLSPALTVALSKSLSSHTLMTVIHDPQYNAIERQFLIKWKIVLSFLELGRASPACECPFVYFFVKTCLDQGAGVPKPALAVYERMKMQLSNEFIRCAYPTCERNRLDQSGAEVKFKKCSRCQVAIYCSRECQVAHYPVHKANCLQQAKA